MRAKWRKAYGGRKNSLAIPKFFFRAKIQPTTLTTPGARQRKQRRGPNDAARPRSQPNRRVNSNVFEIISFADIGRLFDVEFIYSGIRVGTALAFESAGFVQGSPIACSFCNLCLLVCESKNSHIFAAESWKWSQCIARAAQQRRVDEYYAVLAVSRSN